MRDRARVALWAFAAAAFCWRVAANEAPEAQPRAPRLDRPRKSAATHLEAAYETCAQGDAGVADQALCAVTSLSEGLLASSRETLSVGVAKVEGSWGEFAALLAIGLFGFVFVVGALSVGRWVLWLMLGFVLAGCQMFFAAYQLGGIMLSLIMLFSLKGGFTIWRALRYLWCYRVHEQDILHELKYASGVEAYQAAHRDLLEERGQESWCTDGGLVPGADHIRQSCRELCAAREARDLSKLELLLSRVLKRNSLGFEEEELYQPSGAHELVERLLEEVTRAVAAVAEAPDSALAPRRKLSILRKWQRSLGRTALCLSGGGAIAMYHMGVVRTLIECGLYHKIRIISGTSGGSLVAAMLACKTEEELLRDVTVEDISTDFGRDGRMQREDIRWFPPFFEQVLYFVRYGVLVDNAKFRKTCDFYWGSMTFAEAYERTRKHVSITVSSSVLGAAYGAKGGSRLLCNHITTPHVLLRSAVAASCSLPGIMMPNKLEAKNGDGEIVSFDLEGVDWIDGSVQADVPFQQMSTLFGVSNFVVSQVNFHVLPFIRKTYSPNEDSLYGRIFRYVEMDIRYRATALNQLGLFPRFFGQDIARVFKQKYHGNLTIVPQMKMQELTGLKALLNPTRKDMRSYLRGGTLATFPHISRLKAMLQWEACLATAVDEVRRSCDGSLNRQWSVTDRLSALGMAGMLESDDDDAMDAYAAPGAEDEVRILRHEVQRLQREIRRLQDAAR